VYVLGNGSAFGSDRLPGPGFVRTLSVAAAGACGVGVVAAGTGAGGVRVAHAAIAMSMNGKCRMRGPVEWSGALRLGTTYVRSKQRE
jgi:hypothetical protein